MLVESRDRDLNVTLDGGTRNLRHSFPVWYRSKSCRSDQQSYLLIFLEQQDAQYILTSDKAVQKAAISKLLPNYRIGQKSAS
jgi:hypothetical protein